MAGISPKNESILNTNPATLHNIEIHKVITFHSIWWTETTIFINFYGRLMDEIGRTWPKPNQYWIFTQQVYTPNMITF